MIPAVPLPQGGFKVNITSLPTSWLRLASQDAWDEATRRLLERIGKLCQSHVRAVMRGNEPNREGNIVPFLNASGRGIEAVQYKVESQACEIFVDEGASYLTYQEYGNAAMPMKWLVGKTIPYVLVRGSRVNPRTGNVVSGVTRVKFAGPGSRYAGEAGGKIGQTKKVLKEAIDKMVHFSAITEATFSQPSKFNPTGYRWWLPYSPPKHFWRDGILSGLKEVSGHIAGVAFAVAGSNWEPEMTSFVPEYQSLLDELESKLQYAPGRPYPVMAT